MCGIIGALNTGENKEKVNDFIITQYQNQFHRGTKGFGIINIKENLTIEVLRACEPTKMMLDLYMNQSRMMILHHRSPTASENYLDQTHPITIENGSLKHKYLIVHNGVVQNDKELQKKHINKLGFQYNTQYIEYLMAQKWNEKTKQMEHETETKFNDSECVAIEVARFMEKQTDEIEIQGSCAFLGVQIDKKTNKATNIIFGRNEGNPLNMSKSRNKLRLSSIGEGDNIKPFLLYYCEPKTLDLKKKKMKFKETEWKSTKPIGYNTGYNEDIPAEKHWSTHNSDEANKKVEESLIIDEQISECKEQIEATIDTFFEDIIDNRAAFLTQVEDHSKTIIMEMHKALKIAQDELARKQTEDCKETLDDTYESKKEETKKTKQQALLKVP